MGDVKIIKAKASLVGRNRPEGTTRLRVAAYCRVSTNTEEQKESFDSQVKYYTDLISGNKDWSNAVIYADEGITGTSVDKRPQFLRMISDCMDGEIDVILTKSISRFARNTVDTLKYVRALKEKGVSVRFEEERIDSLTANGELMMTVLSSVAQQEVANTSEHVKRGLSMRMTRGQLVGFPACLGYDYDPASKTISINPAQAEVVRYIFKRYLEGAGTTVLARELKEHGYKTRAGSLQWQDTTILGIIQNEKYKGDVLQGKTFTVDPISGRRLANRGEADQFYIAHHHPAIISESDFEEANKIRLSRSYNRKLDVNGSRTKFSRQYVFSSMLECGFCHNTLVRRAWSSGQNYHVDIWQCESYAKSGKAKCHNSKGLPETVLEKAFVEAYNAVVGKDSSFVEEFIKDYEDVLAKGTAREKAQETDKKISVAKGRMNRLAELYMDDAITKDSYDAQYTSLTLELKKLNDLKAQLDFSGAEEEALEKRLADFRIMMGDGKGKKLEAFSKAVFETCVSKVIVGGEDENHQIEPYKMTFVFKNGFKKAIEEGKMDHSVPPDSGTPSEEPKKFMTIKKFNMFWKHIAFMKVGEDERRKVMSDFVPVEVVLPL
jgi:DNA invertase Pin-like site-specific DNA recombinase